MKKQLQEKLFNKYPKIFRQKDLPMTQTAMCWGFECNDGWHDLIDILCSLLSWDIEHNKYPEIEASQVKEKLGTLRFYASGIYKEERSSFKIRIKEHIYNWLSYLMRKLCKERIREIEERGVQEGMIRFAEYLSGFICEKCGSNSNVTQTTGWITTLCDNCMKEYEKQSKTAK